jgi:hypothetical protein
MTEVSFQGEAPFGLPAVQSTAVVAHGETVEVTFYMFVRGALAPVRAQMVEKVASALASQLTQAAAEARANEQDG